MPGPSRVGAAGAGTGRGGGAGGSGLPSVTVCSLSNSVRGARLRFWRSTKALARTSGMPMATASDSVSGSPRRARRRCALATSLR